MRYLTWLLRAILFLALLGFAVKNDQPVVLRYFFGYEWQSSLVVVLLLFFAVGVGIGMLAVLGNVFRQRKEIAVLKRELHLKNKLAGAGETQQIPIQPS
ncbi:MAG: LapA family protein [Betaproteobacteria bacterium]|nr:LapA family protein [Betaproteobacteria bacterium]